MNLHTESQRGHTAKQLLENDIYKETFTLLRESIIQKWRDCPIRDKDGQHELKLMDKILSDIERHIKQVAETGKLADIQLEQEAKVEKIKATKTKPWG